MKTTILYLLFLFLISFTLQAQELKAKRPGHFGLSYTGIGVSQESWVKDPMRYYDSYGTDYYREKMFYAIGLNYLKPLGSWLDLETGVEYSRKLGEVKTVFFDDYVITKANVTMLSIPVTFRANFLRFFFVNTGLMTDFDLGGSDPSHYQSDYTYEKVKRYQSGIGCVAGLGVKYDFKYGGQIFINPYFKRRAFISFSSDEDHLKADETGIRVGIYFNTMK